MLNSLMFSLLLYASFIDEIVFDRLIISLLGDGATMKTSNTADRIRGTPGESGGTAGESGAFVGTPEK